METLSPKKLAYILGPLFAVALVLAIVLWATTKDPEVKGKIRTEFTKSLLQLSVVVIVGGAVAAMYQSVEAHREQQQKEAERRRLNQERDAENRRKENLLRAEIRADYLKRLSTLYRTVKSARRAIRAIGITTKYSNPPSTIQGEPAEFYKGMMERLDKAQLELEGLQIEAERLPAYISLKGVADQLHIMEEYLREILHEYEAQRPAIDAKQSVPFKKFVRLDEFTGSTKEKFKWPSNVKEKKQYRFKDHFSEPYKSIIKEISNSLS